MKNQTIHCDVACENLCEANRPELDELCQVVWGCGTETLCFSEDQCLVGCNCC